ncbi:hypothetical protein SOM26_01060 [Sphingomonas sp. CFBP8993]|uniref:DUF4350 domain-containing protein n=1 Tax=Sphingomonas sp. CFBP8993 TaxID=3096526 RepID=UPI002A6B0CF3|nr:hypothetical protein [Sphingomonas sp. CFBP8993]MDY0957267.1 hypothetical protein [Sphingomonas sp. CFBP8993]
MSEIAMRATDKGRTGPVERLFSPLTVALLLVIGILGFAGSMLLGAYAPDMRSGHDGGTHALSNAATGFSGIVALAGATGRNPRIIRAETDWATDDLVVVTPDHGWTDLSKLMATRKGRATLLVMPKWLTLPDKGRPGWVKVAGLLPAIDPARILAPATEIAVSRHASGGRPLQAVRWAPDALNVAAPRPLQVMTSKALQPIVTDDAGGIVLGQVGDSSIFILADPDLLNNHGIRRLDRARAGLAIFDFVRDNGSRGIAFDVSLNGLGVGRSPLKLAFEPPFLAMTLAIVVALALVGWQALIRFGAPRPPERAIAFGKAALVDNSAMIVRKAGREGGLGPRYAALVRERARAIFGVPVRLTDAEADAYLDRMRGRGTFTALVDMAAGARHPADMLASAQALHQWQQEKTR